MSDEPPLPVDSWNSEYDAEPRPRRPEGRRHQCTTEDCGHPCRVEDGRPERSVSVMSGDVQVDGEGPCMCEEHETDPGGHWVWQRGDAPRWSE